MDSAIQTDTTGECENDAAYVATCMLSSISDPDDYKLRLHLPSKQGFPWILPSINKGYRQDAPLQPPASNHNVQD
jgi:hypothetical protein